MEKYVAFLRAINVSGHNSIKMIDLKLAFEQLSYQNVKTYIQSGNVVFETHQSDTANIRQEIEKKLKQTFGNEIVTIIRTMPEMFEIVQSQPFASEILASDKKIYVGFLADIPNETLAYALEAMSYESENFSPKGKNLYYWGEKGLKKELFSNNFIEKKLKVSATTRNWNTVNKMLEF
jgi:uncharacterized protein (DUF1697 family)